MRPGSLSIALGTLLACALACGGEPRQTTTPAPPPQVGPPGNPNPDVVDPPAPDPGKQVLAEVRSMATEMCACADYGCAQKTARVFAIWLKDAPRRYHQRVLDEHTAEFMRRFEQLRVCHNRRAPPDKRMADPKQKGSAEAAKLERFADIMCACKGAACALATLKSVTEWMGQTFKTRSARQGSPTMVKRWQAAQTRMNTCFVEAQRKGHEP